MITVVTGPPGSGKSTFIKDQAKPGDVVIDMDDLANVLWVPLSDDLHDYPPHIRHLAQVVRLKAIRQAIKLSQVHGRMNVWIVDTDPPVDRRAEYRAVNARIVPLDPGQAVCLERVKKRNPGSWRRLEEVIRQFYVKNGSS
jgi:predicted ABC-type ATPase